MIAQISSVLLLLARNRVLLTVVVVVFDVAWCLREADETANLEDNIQSRSPFRLPVEPEGNWFFRVFEKEEFAELWLEEPLNKVDLVAFKNKQNN